MKNLTESSTKVYFTKDYGSFKFLKGNRDINESKTKKIIKSIKEGVNILKYAPIIVNENMEIIDGQHRFSVSMTLKDNVYFVIMRSDLASLGIVPAINSNSSNWKTKDFLNSYVDLKKENYILINEFLNEFPRVALPTAINLIGGGKQMEEFKDGSITVDGLDSAKELAEKLTDLEPFTKNPFSRRFFMVMNQLNNGGKYDHEKMIDKLKASGRMIENVDTSKLIIQDMESIMNFKAKERILII